MVIQFIDGLVTSIAKNAVERFLSRNAVVRVFDVIIERFLRTQRLTALAADEIASFLMHYFHVRF